MPGSRPRSVTPRSEGWIRELEDGRIEIYLKDKRVPVHKVRASGPHDEMVELVEWFEAKTGLAVHAPILRRKHKPIPGQTALDLGSGEASTQLSSGATLGTDA